MLCVLIYISTLKQFTRGYMKKFTKILICLLLCVFGMGLVACGDKKVDYSTTGVRGNDGLCVQKGDYIYFVNGYQSADNVEDRDNGEILGSLMMAKVTNAGIQDSVLICDSLCGFESTGLYVFGDYIYFTTPCLDNVYDDELDEEVLANDRVDFKRVKIGESKTEMLHRSSVNNENLTFNYYTDGKSLYLVAYEKGNSLDNDKADVLYRVNVEGGKKDIISTNVNSVVFGETDDIFYTSSKTENDDTSYNLIKYNPLTGKSGNCVTKDSEITVKDVKQDYAYYTVANEFVTSNVDLYRLNVSTNTNDFICDATSFKDSVYFTDDCYVIAVSDKLIEAYIGTSNIPTKIAEEESSVKVIGLVDGSIIYYDGSNNIKKVSYYIHGEIETLATVEGIADSQIDFDNGYMYFYKTVNSNKYLHRLKIVNNNNEEVEMLGIYLKADMPKEEEV